MTENLPARWDEELAKYATAAAALERPAVGRLGFRAGVMTYQNQVIPGNKLNVVIVASAKEHALYRNVLEQRAFDPSNPESPICFALSLTGEEMVPHPQAPQKMSETCATCRYNAWGSAPNGGRGKACKESRRMVLLPQTAVVSNGAPSPAGSVKKAEAASASIPVTSVKNWANYTAQLAGEFRRPPWAMITEISAHPHPKTVFEIKFSPVGLVSETHFGDLMQRIETSNQIVLTPYSQETKAVPAQPQANRKY